MALVLGTNAGFITAQPVGDPVAGFDVLISGWALALKDTIPSTATTITEIGFWAGLNNSAGENWEVGLYEDDGAGDPGNAIERNQTNVMTSGIEWKGIVGLNIDVSLFQNQGIWIAIQLDAGINIRTDRTDTGQGTAFVDTSSTTLADPFDAGANSSRIYALYAVWEAAAAGVTRKIKIAGTFQDKPIKTKVGGVFVDKPIKIKVGGTFQDA